MENISKNLKVNTIDNHFSGSISVTQGFKKQVAYRSIYSASKWFSDAEFYVFDYQPDCLRIKKCLCIEIPKQAHKISKGNFTFITDIPIGVYHFDEEDTTHDEAIIYFNQE